MSGLPTWAASDRALLVHAPGNEAVPEITDGLQRRGWTVRAADVGDGTDALQQAHRDHAPGVVVVAGGDGTVSAAADLVLDQSVPLCVLAQGTANLLASALGLPDTVAEGLRLLDEGHPQAVDAHAVGERVSVSHLSIGVYAEMAKLVPGGLKRVSGVGAYVWAALRALARTSPMRVEVTCDGGAPASFESGLLMVANIGDVGIGAWSWLAKADPTDGVGHVIVHPPLHSGALPGLVGQLRSGVPVRARVLPFTDSVTIQVEPAQDVRLDGELHEPTQSIEVALRPGAIRVLVA